MQNTQLDLKEKAVQGWSPSAPHVYQQDLLMQIKITKENLVSMWIRERERERETEL
jgi:hypothetical protein